MGLIMVELLDMKGEADSLPLDTNSPKFEQIILQGNTHRYHHRYHTGGHINKFESEIRAELNY